MEEIAFCKCCDNVVALKPFREGYLSVCPHCGAVLRPAKIFPLSHIAAVAFSAILLLLGCIPLPFISVSSLGISNNMSLFSIFTVLENGWNLLLQIFTFVTFIFPSLVLSTMVWVGLLRKIPSKLLCVLYSYSYIFCMVDVFVLGVAISLIKLTSLATVTFHTGFYLVFVFSIMMVWCCSKCKPKTIWELYMSCHIENVQIGITARKQNIKVCRHCGMAFYATNPHDKEHCPRCGANVAFRSDHWVQKITALLLAALIMYLPSNLYPVMYTDYLGVNMGSNIIDGVFTLWNMGSYFVALVILIASIFIPVFKILAIAYLVYEVKFSRRTRSKFLSKLYRIICVIGKWSMIDVFVVIIMSSIVRMSGLLTINPGFAIICFCMVVLVTIFAAEEFDERLIWDKVFV